MIKQVTEGIRYQKLTEEEKKARGILGRLVGPCADFNNATRNGRKYSEQLWENVFNNPIMQEKIKNKVCYGELGHPEDRAEIDPEKIAVCLSEVPVKNKNGQLEAVFDILDTPNGRILKTLCDYGSTLGVSSRGQGDIVTDYEGNETVDPDTYECECWDIVLIPAVKEARLQYVREGLDSKKSLKTALTEAFNKEDEEGKKVMAETLKDLNIDINEAKEPKYTTSIDIGSNVKDFKKECKENGIKIKVVGDTVDGTDYNRPGVTGIEVVGTKEELLKLKDIDIPVDERTFEPFNESLNAADDKLISNPAYDNTAKRKARNAAVEKGISKLANESLDEDIDNEAEVDAEVTEPEVNVDELEVTEPGAENDDAALDEPEEEEETDEEVFLNYLLDNFDEKQVKKACKALGIDIPEDGEEDADEDDESKDEAEDKEDTKDDENSTDEKSDEDKDEEEEDKVEEALDKGSTDLLNNLQEALKGKLDLEKLIKELKEQLAVSDAKVNELTEECNRYKSSIARLATVAKSSKDLQKSVEDLNESLKAKDQTIEDQKARIARLAQSRKDSVKESLTLNESVSAKEKELATLNESVDNLKKDYEAKFKQLREQVVNESAQAKKKESQLNESLTKANALKESYKKLANEAMNMLIEERATQLGLTSQDIKRKLGASYTIADVNTVCEELKRYQLNVSKLPFSIDRKVGVRVNEAVSKSAINKAASKQFEDDEVDDSLMRMANLY